MQADRR
ncbi:hypothetical protein D030_1305A, partial [Vibrio parahaemolyticus AQ3810]